MSSAPSIHTSIDRAIHVPSSPPSAAAAEWFLSRGDSTTLPSGRGAPPPSLTSESSPLFCFRRVFHDRERDIFVIFESFFLPNDDVVFTCIPATASAAAEGVASALSRRSMMTAAGFKPRSDSGTAPARGELAPSPAEELVRFRIFESERGRFDNLGRPGDFN